MATPTQETEDAVGAEAEAGSAFGNREAITATQFGVPDINSNPTQPDFTSEGKVISAQAILSGIPFISKSVKIPAKPDQSTVKSVYVQSDVAGTWKIQVMLDESEVVSGLPVWRDYTNGPITTTMALVSGALSCVTVYDLFRQIRVVVTPGSNSTNTNAWVFSVP
jgi:hypothetical protein